MTTNSKSRYFSTFGSAVAEHLAKRGMTQLDLARSVKHSPSSTNMVLTGSRGASPEWVELVSRTLKLSVKEEQKLHYAAAKDHGFKLDLTKK